MRRFVAPALLAFGALSLTACGDNSSDQLAEQVEDAAENRADMMEAQAENLMERAERTEEIGEQRADAIEAADQNVSAIPMETRQEIISNEAAAVR
jgi:hypothetical protein